MLFDSDAGEPGRMISGRNKPGERWMDGLFYAMFPPWTWGPGFSSSPDAPPARAVAGPEHHLPGCNASLFVAGKEAA